MRYFEDLVIGERRELGPYVVTETEIVEFASRWDPQWFHTDPGAARSSIYSSVIASGIHSAAIMTRLMVTGWLHEIANLGSPGLEAMAFPNPVRPGDELRVVVEVLEARASTSRPDRGIVRFAMTLRNQGDQTVLETATTIFVARRQPASD